MDTKTKEVNKEIAKLKLFSCKRCKKKVSAIWRITITAIGVSADICDECKEILGDKIVEFMKDRR